MVERSRRNTVRRHWRDYRGQCQIRHRRRGGLHRRVFGRLGAPGRARRSGFAIISALCLALTGLNATAQELQPAAETEAPAPSYEEAKLAYQNGNVEKALKLAAPHAESGNAEAQVMLGHIYLRGETAASDPDKAARYFRLAADQKDTDAYMALGEIALTSKAGLSPSDAMTWFSRASIAGRVDAKRAIGEMYIKGQGIAPNLEKGRDWLQQAIDSGDAFAARTLADTYFETDANRALSLYEQAASYGDSDAAYIAAIMLAENLDVRPDSAKLADLLLQAAEAGHAAAQADYGLLAYQGAGVVRSAETAAKWFKKSAEGGDSEGQFLYAYTLAKGEGLEKSFEEAYFWLLKSGESDVDAYQQDREVLKKRLEDNVDADILKRARKRYKAG